MRILLSIVFGLVTQLAIAQEEYAVPVNENNYAADWMAYQPNASKKQDGRVVYSGVRFISSQEDFEKNTTAKEVAKFVGFIQEILTKEAEGYGEGGEILLHIKLRKEANPVFKMSNRGELTQDYLQGFYEALSAIDYKMKESAVVLQIRYIVKNA